MESATVVGDRPSSFEEGDDVRNSTVPDAVVTHDLDFLVRSTSESFPGAPQAASSYLNDSARVAVSSHETAVAADNFTDSMWTVLETQSAELKCSSRVEFWHWNLTGVFYPGPRPATSWSELPTNDQIKIGAFAVASFFALVGNAAVISLVFKNRSLRNSVNYYLVNLALCDIVIAAFCAWVYIIEKVTDSPWVLGPFLCKINGFLQMTALTGSALTLTAIAIDRLMAVRYPLRRMHMHCGKIIVLIWTAAVSVSIPFLVFREMVTIKWRDFDENICVETWPREVGTKADGTCHVDRVWHRVYYTVITVAMFFLPLFVMGVTYCMIGIHMWRRRMPGGSELTNPDAYEAQRRCTRMKVLRMVIVVMVVFCVCWAPLQFINIYAMWGQKAGVHDIFQEWYEVTLFVAYCLAYSNSTINPLLYGGLNPEIRKIFSQMVSAVRGRNVGSTRTRSPGTIEHNDNETSARTISVRMTRSGQQSQRQQQATGVTDVNANKGRIAVDNGNDAEYPTAEV